MSTCLRLLSKTQQLILGTFAAYTLAIGILGAISASALVGTPSFGVLMVWSGARGCPVVNAITPASWVPIASGALQIGDCIEQVDGIDISQQSQITRHLIAHIEAQDANPNVLVQARRSETSFVVRVPAFRIQPIHVFQVELSLFLVGGMCWSLALFVYLTRPSAESNQVFAGFFWIVALFLFGQHHTFDPPASAYFTAFSTMPGLSLIGPILTHLACCVPRPLTRHPWLRFVLYVPAIITLLPHLNNNVGLVDVGPWGSLIARAAEATGGSLMAIGLALFLGRMAYLARTHWPAEIHNPARALLFSWSFCIPLGIGLAYYFVGHQAPLGLSLHTLLFLVVPPLTGTAFAMLRYQVFSYRGQVLTGLTTTFLSATMACLVMLMMTLIIPGSQADGVLFVIVWTGALTTTIFWYVNNPARRAFQHFFLRHQQDYKITRAFVAETGTEYRLEPLIHTAVKSLQQKLNVTWVAIALNHLEQRCWVATEEDTAVMPVAPEGAPLPGVPLHTRNLQTLKGSLGTLWIGPRLSSEPFDTEDEYLITLLADSLTRTLLSAIQIEHLARVPGLVLEAQEQERLRIGQEIHDAVAPFFGALPLLLERGQILAQRTSETQPELIALLRAGAQRSAASAQDLRSIIGELHPPDVAGSQFVPKIHELVMAICQPHEIAVVWEDLGIWDGIEPSAALQFYRIVQQAVTNVIEHAAATNLTVRLTADQAAFTVQVSDNGRGFEGDLAQQREGHFGLTIMRTRAQVAGGECLIRSEPGQGTQIKVRIPTQGRAEAYDPTGLLKQVGIRHTDPTPTTLPTVADQAANRRSSRWRMVVAGLHLPSIIVIASVCMSGLFLFLAFGKNVAPACDNQIVHRCTIAANHAWQRTGIMLNPEDTVHIKAIGGEWSTDAVGDGTLPPVGASGYRGDYYGWTSFPEAPLGALIGRVGNDDNPLILVGSESTFTAGVPGELYLQINDGTCSQCKFDNIGQIIIFISIYPR